MKIECKLRDYRDETLIPNEERVIVRRPDTAIGMVELMIGNEEVLVDSAELIHAIRSCTKDDDE